MDEGELHLGPDSLECGHTAFAALENDLHGRERVGVG